MAIVDELIAVLGYKVEGDANARSFEKRMDSIARRTDNVAKGIGRVAGIASAALGAAFATLGGSVISTTAKFETYEATLKTIEGSSEKARASLDFISEFAKSTPFEIDELTSSFVKLKAYGIDPIANNTLRVLGDTASAMGKDLEQAVEAFADAATGEFERLKEFGVKASTAGDQVTFKWTQNGKELSKTVKKGSEEIRGFLLENFGQRFNGAMAEQSKTFKGMTSNLSDVWVDFKRRIGEAGFFDEVKAQLKSLLDAISVLNDNGTLDEWASNLSSALTTSAKAFQAVAGRIVKHIKFLSENFESMKPTLTAIGGLLMFLTARAFPMITAFAVLGVVVEDLLTYFQGGESVIGDLIAKFSELTGAGEGVSKTMVAIAAAIATGLTAAFVTSPVKFVSKFGRIIITGIATLAPLIVSAIGLIMNPVALGIIAVAAALGLIYAFRDEIMGFDWAGLGSSIGTFIVNGIKSVGSGVKDFFTSMIPDWAKSGLGLTDDTSTKSKSTFVPTQSMRDEDKVMRGFVTPRMTDSERRQQGAATAQPSSDLVTKIQSMLSGWNANMASMLPENAVNATVTDGRQDNRQFPFTSNVTINQNVTGASNAPSAAAKATGSAVSGAITSQRSQVSQEPSF